MRCPVATTVTRIARGACSGTEWDAHAAGTRPKPRRGWLVHAFLAEQEWAAGRPQARAARTPPRGIFLFLVVANRRAAPDHRQQVAAAAAAAVTTTTVSQSSVSRELLERHRPLALGACPRASPRPAQLQAILRVDRIGDIYATALALSVNPQTDRQAD